MFGWFKAAAKPPDVLHFKSSDAAFEYATQYVRRPLVTDAIVIGQILSIVAPSHGALLKQSQKWRVRLATDQGVLETDHCGSIADSLMADLKIQTPSAHVGDLVAVRVGVYDSKYPPESQMQYFVIICKLKPSLRVDGNVFLPDAGG